MGHGLLFEQQHSKLFLSCLDLSYGDSLNVNDLKYNQNSRHDIASHQMVTSLVSTITYTPIVASHFVQVQFKQKINVACKNDYI